MFDPQSPTGGDAILGLFIIYFSIASCVWMWRNPTANNMTCFSRINHVVCFDKMQEYQVVETDKSL